MASFNDEKLKIMEDEMNRFEEEIGLPNAPDTCQVIGTGTYDQVQRQLDMDAPLAPPPLIPPPPPPPPMFIPQQVRMGPPGLPMPGMGPPMPDQRPGHPGMNFIPGPGPGPMGPGPGPMGSGPGPMGPGPGPMGPGPGPMGPFGGPMGPGPMGFRPPGPPMGPPGMMPPGMCPPGPPRHPGHMPPGFPMGPMSNAPPMMAPPMMPPVEFESPPVIQKKPTPAKVVLSATPKLYISKKPESNGSAPVIGVSEMPRVDPPPDDPSKKAAAAKKQTPQKPGGVVAKEMAEKVKASAVVSITMEASASNAANNTQTSKKKDKKSKKFIRTAGGNSWEDSSLCEWEEDDFRLFCGDLGNDVTDEVLTRAFSKYPSFLKAKVVRDKRTNKTKGFGFVSFKDPQDFIRATKEMNGRYVGSRPIKLRKSTWRQRSLEVVRKKDKEKQALIGLLTGR